MLDRQNIDKMCALTELEFKNAESEAYFYKTMKDCEGKDAMSIINYAIRWGKVMQYLIDQEGQDLTSIADDTSYECDYEGMSGHTFGLAVHFLTNIWKYGEELRLWHNKQYDYEGKGVVNPAVIHIKTDNDEKSL